MPLSPKIIMWRRIRFSVENLSAETDNRNTSSNRDRGCRTQPSSAEDDLNWRAPFIRSNMAAPSDGDNSPGLQENAEYTFQDFLMKLEEFQKAHFCVFTIRYARTVQKANHFRIPDRCPKKVLVASSYLARIHCIVALFDLCRLG